MKTQRWFVLCFILLLIQLVACERSKIEENVPTPISARTGLDSADVPEPGIRKIITEKVTGIEQKAPTLFTLVNGLSQFVKWRVSPATATHNNGPETTIYFQQAGMHRVFAIDSLSNDTTYIDVEVTNTVYQIPDPAKPTLPDDILKITPIALSDTAENVLLLQCSTEKTYPCAWNQLVGHLSKNGNNTRINFEKMLTGFNCGKDKQSPGTGNIFIQDIPATFEGPIEIHFNDKIYLGSMKRTGKSSYEFTWPHTTGVILTKKSL